MLYFWQIILKRFWFFETDFSRMPGITGGLPSKKNCLQVSNESTTSVMMNGKPNTSSIETTNTLIFSCEGYSGCEEHEGHSGCATSTLCFIDMLTILYLFYLWMLWLCPVQMFNRKASTCRIIYINVQSFKYSHWCLCKLLADKNSLLSHGNMTGVQSKRRKCLCCCGSWNSGTVY